MPQVLLVNPSAPPKRKGARKERTMAKKRRTAAQRAATRKMIAANRARRGGGSVRKAHRRRASTKRRAARKTVVVRMSNPAPHRRRARRAMHRMSNPVHRRRSRARRRNPAGFIGDFMSMAVPSAIGAAGALGLDVMMGVLPLPDSFKTGPMRPVARIAGAAGLGVIAGMVTSRSNATKIATGALTVVLYDLMKGALAKVAGGKIPGLGVYEIPGIGPYQVMAAPAQPSLGYYDAGMQVGNDAGMGEYVSEYVSGEPGVYR